MLSDEKERKRKAIKGAELASFASLSPSSFALAELERRYPGETPTRAIDRALERLRTLEEVLEVRNVDSRKGDTAVATGTRLIWYHRVSDVQFICLM